MVCFFLPLKTQPSASVFRSGGMKRRRYLWRRACKPRHGTSFSFKCSIHNVYAFVTRYLVLNRNVSTGSFQLVKNHSVICGSTYIYTYINMQEGYLYLNDCWLINWLAEVILNLFTLLNFSYIWLFELYMIYNVWILIWAPHIHCVTWTIWSLGCDSGTLMKSDF